MIVKDPKFKNKYIFQSDSTNEEWKEIQAMYGKNLNCIICNRNTSSIFKPSFLSFGHSIITINNKIPDGVVYINGVY